MMMMLMMMMLMLVMVMVHVWRRGRGKVRTWACSRRQHHRTRIPVNIRRRTRRRVHQRVLGGDDFAIEPALHLLLVLLETLDLEASSVALVIYSSEDKHVQDEE